MEDIESNDIVTMEETMFHFLRRDSEISLNGKWLMACQSGKIVPKEVPKDLSSWDWFETNIPNSVQAALFEAGKIEDPYFGKNCEKFKWIIEKNWWFRKTFRVPEVGKGKIIYLYFEGVDHHGYFWLNGHYLCRHEGMYGGPVCDVSSFLKFEEDNELVVCIESTVREEKNFSIKGPLGNAFFTKLIKGLAVYGWCCPDLKSVGIWRPVRIVVLNSLFLESPFIFTRRLEKNKAFLEGSVEVYNLSNKKRIITIQGEIRPKGFRTNHTLFQKEVLLSKGKNFVQFKVEMSASHLWWPWDMGEPNLYLLELLLQEKKTVFDKVAVQFGVRLLEWDGLKLSINACSIFIKGTHHVPLDLLLRENRKWRHWLFSLAKNAHINAFRCWGHGHIESDLFYEMCDEMGIMVWQEFPITCDFLDKDKGIYGERPRDTWTEQVDISVRRLRNHPSLIAWCGGNEFYPDVPENRDLVDIAENICLKLDGTRLFRRSCPSPDFLPPVPTDVQDPRGDAHPYIYFSGYDFTWHKIYKELELASEFGIPGSIPNLVNLKKFLPPEELAIVPIQKAFEDATAMLHHSTEAELNPDIVSLHYTNPYGIAETIDDLIKYRNLVPSFFNEYAIGFWRANWPTTSGLFHMSFNQLWPELCYTSVIDWYGLPMIPYYYLSRSYEPIHICAILPWYLWRAGEIFSASVYVINDTQEICRDYEVIATIMDEQFNLLWERSCRIDITGKHASTKTLAVKWQIEKKLKNKLFLLCVSLKNEKGRTISRSLYFPSCYRLLDFEEFRRKYREDAQRMIDFRNGPWLSELSKTKTQLAIDLPAKVNVKKGKCTFTLKVKNIGGVPSFQTGIEISSSDCLYYCSDNYFFLFPGEEKEMELHLFFDVLCPPGQITFPIKRSLSIEVSAWNAPKKRGEINYGE